MRIIHVTFIGLVLFVSACAKTDPIPPATYTCSDVITHVGDQHPKANELNALLDKQLPQFVGVQVALTDASGQRWSGARGMADIQADVELLTCHRIPIASISKTITATVILQQVDDGLLTLEDNVSDYLPVSLIGEIDNASESTLRHFHTRIPTSYC